jgi:hypothetical protein
MHMHMQVKALLLGDVDVLAQDSKGLTVLHIAASKGHVGMIKVLAASGGRDLVSKTCTLGMTAQDYAACHKHKDAEEVLKSIHESIKRDKQHKKEEHRTCDQLAAQKTAEYGALENITSLPLTVEEYKPFFFHILASIRRKDQRATHDKFVVDPRELVCGELEHAALGFFRLINVSENELFQRALAGVCMCCRACVRAESLWTCMIVCLTGSIGRCVWCQSVRYTLSFSSL